MASQTDRLIDDPAVARSPEPMSLPLGAVTVALGFPSPAEDFEEARIDLNQLLIHNPPATFLYRAHGTSMIDAGICDGDILIIDRSVTPRDGDIVIATWEGNQPTCKILRSRSDHLELHGCNPLSTPIHLNADTDVEILAVTGVVRTLARRHRHTRI